MEEFHLIRPKNADFMILTSGMCHLYKLSSRIVQPVRISSFSQPGHEPDGHRELNAFFSTLKVAQTSSS